MGDSASMMRETAPNSSVGPALQRAGDDPARHRCSTPLILFPPWWAVVIVAAAQAFTLVSISLKIRQEERRRA